LRLFGSTGELAEGRGIVIAAERSDSLNTREGGERQTSDASMPSLVDYAQWAKPAVPQGRVAGTAFGEKCT
jgi:hypothetical protein